MNYIAEKKIDGVIYKARYRGIGFSMELNDLMEDDYSSLKLAEILFTEILISPKVEIDDFADINTYSRVFAFLLDVANGIGITKTRSKSGLKQRARDNWSLWRLIFQSDGAIDFPTVFGREYMTPQDVAEANFALDMYIEAQKRAAKKK